MTTTADSTAAPPTVSIALIKAIAAELDADRRAKLLGAARAARTISPEQAADLSDAIHMADLRRDKPAPEGELSERGIRELLQHARIPTIVAVREVAKRLDGSVDEASRQVLLRVADTILDGPGTRPLSD